MAPGTSPRGESPSERWAHAVADSMHAGWSRPPGLLGRSIDWPSLARGAAALHVMALGLIVTAAWQEGTGAVAAANGLSGFHLVFLLATGAATAFLAMRPRHRTAPVAAEDCMAPVGAGQLLAQLSHDLRTPLTAVIGFSEAMRRELHGPLGHARYQEYAAHISESGGRLLKASEEALAVAATMSALMADRHTVRRERVLAATLLEEAWAAAAAGEPRWQVRFAVVNCGDEIECDRRATAQALEHLLREAIVRLPPDGLLEAGVNWRGDCRGIEIRVRPSQGMLPPETRATDGERDQNGSLADGGGLRELLARSLLEMQGATFSRCSDPAWSARVAFPGLRCRRGLSLPPVASEAKTLEEAKLARRLRFAPRYVG